MVLLVETAHGGEDEQQVGLNQNRHLRREVVVVPELDLVDRHRVVLVDHGEYPGCEQGLQRVPGIEIALPVVHVVPGEKDSAPCAGRAREKSRS